MRVTSAQPTAHRVILPLTTFRPKIDAEIARRFREWQRTAERIDPEYGRLIGEMRQFIARGGKRLRPYLCYLGYIGYGGDQTSDIIAAAAAQELYHNAWLIHDDIVDRDITRYGGLNLTGRYVEEFSRTLSDIDARHLADAMALIAGNVNMALATDVLLGSSFPAERILAATRREQALIFELAGGEQLDLLVPIMATANLSTERLLKVCHYKTATYTFEAPLQIGAILAGAGTTQVEAIRAVAVPLGTAYQLQDDKNGLFASETQTGKPALSDLQEGKRTILMLDALKRATPADQAVLTRWLGNPAATMDNLQEVRDVLVKTGSVERINQLIADQYRHALTALPATGLSEDVQSILKSLFLISE